MTSAPRVTLICLFAVLASAPSRAFGQGGARFHPRWEIPGLDFSRGGVWRGRARQVRANRARLLAGRRFSALNAPALRGVVTATAVSGTIVEPVVLIKYADTPPSQILGDTLAYDSVLYAENPPNGRPYTVRTYYEQLTTLNGNPPLITITGKSFGFVPLSQNEVAYTGTPGTCSGNPYGTANCNGIFSGTATQQMQTGLREALAYLDSGVDWRQFTSHGDTLDLVVFVQPGMDGACGGATNNHIWAHRYYLLQPYQTHSIGPGGSALTVVDYIVQSGVGGASSCDTMQIMPVGTVAHETGHGFDLPDLYDTQGLSQGVGEFSLMGSGNYTSPYSPSRMDAWSLSQLGWVSVVPLTSSGDYSFGGAPVSDTTFHVPVRGVNPRGEYFLLENRQGLKSDSAMIAYHCRVSYRPSAPPPGCGGGLLVYHVDSTQMALHGFNQDNTVNFGPIHGLELEQADGRGDLDAGRNRGDAGDPYPGTTSNTVYSYNSTPAAVKNSDGKFVGFAIDSIRQVTTSGPMAMSIRLRFGQPLAFAAGAHGSVNASPAGDTSGSFLAESSAVTLTAVPNGSYIFAGWNGDTSAVAATLTLSMVRPFNVTANFGTPLAVTTLHTLPGALMGTPYVDTLHASGGTGAYTWQLVGAAPPSLVLSASGVITGTPSQVGTFSLQATVTSVSLEQTDTFTVTTIAPTLTTASVVAELLSGAATLTAGDLTYLDLLGNQNGQFDLGDFLAWVNATGAP